VLLLYYYFVVINSVIFVSGRDIIHCMKCLFVCLDMHCSCDKLVQPLLFDRTGCDLIVGEGSCL